MLVSPLIPDPFLIADTESVFRSRRRLLPLPQVLGWTATIQGSCVRVKRHFGVDLDAVPPPRGVAGPMSHASRMRLLCYLNRIDWDNNPPCWFLTLTYPDAVYHRDYRLRSRDRYLFLRYLEKWLGKKIPCVWRVEWKPRLSGKRLGELMPHWHLLCTVDGELSNAVVNLAWRKAIGLGEGPLQTRSKLVIGSQGAIKYVAKYTSKVDALDIAAYHNTSFQFGRSWGITRKHLFVMSPIVFDRVLTQVQINAVKAFAGSKNLRYAVAIGGGFTLLGKEYSEFLYELLK